MPLTVRQDGQTVGGQPNNATAAWWNDYHDLLTGVMTDQLVTIGNTLTVTGAININTGLKIYYSSVGASAFGMVYTPLNNTAAQTEGHVFQVWDGTTLGNAFSIGNGNPGASQAYVDNTGAFFGYQVSSAHQLFWGSGTNAVQSSMDYDATDRLNTYWTPQSGTQSNAHFFVTWNGSAQVNLFGVGGGGLSGLAGVDNSGNFYGSAGTGIPTTRNGSALSVPIYTGTTTPTNPPTGSIWIKA